MRLNLEGGVYLAAAEVIDPLRDLGLPPAHGAPKRLIFPRQMENKLPFKHMKREGNDGSEGRAGQAEVGSTYSL